MPSASLLIEQEDGVQIITLNRPDKLNAIDEEMKLALTEMLEMIRRDDGVKAIIFTGAGRGFCSGADLAAPNVEKVVTRNEITEPMGVFVFHLAMLDKPVIAAINGVAAGAGLSLALACDIRIASPQAKFTPLWVKRGMVPDAGATFLLPKLIGVSRALELMYSGNSIDAVTAEKLGLVSQIVAPDQLLVRAREIAIQWAKGPSVAMELLKRVVCKNMRTELEAQLYYETMAQNICLKTEDCKEAVNAFLEKREPVFRGK